MRASFEGGEVVLFDTRVKQVYSFAKFLKKKLDTLAQRCRMRVPLEESHYDIPSSNEEGSVCLGSEVNRIAQRFEFRRSPGSALRSLTIYDKTICVGTR